MEPYPRPLGRNMLKSRDSHGYSLNGPDSNIRSLGRLMGSNSEAGNKWSESSKPRTCRDEGWAASVEMFYE